MEEDEHPELGACVPTPLPLARTGDFTKAHIHVLHQRSLSMYLVPNAVLGTADTAVSKRVIQGKCRM